MTAIAISSPQSNRNLSVEPQYDVDTDSGEAPTVEAELTLVSALDHLEALALLWEYRTPLEAKFNDVFKQVEILSSAMQAAIGLCSLGGSDISVTVPVEFARSEIALLALAHSHAAAHYRDEEFPDTAAIYRGEHEQLLLALVEATTSNTDIEY